MVRMATYLSTRLLLSHFNTFSTNWIKNIEHFELFNHFRGVFLYFMLIAKLRINGSGNIFVVIGIVTSLDPTFSHDFVLGCLNYIK